MHLTEQSVTYEGTPTGVELRTIPRELWLHRELAYQLALRDVKIRYKQSIMGFGWAVLMPGLVVMAGVLIRYAMARLGGSELQTSDLAGVTVKAVPWSFFVSAIGFASLSLTSNAALITKIYFPREVLPIAAVAAHAFDALIAGTVVAVVLLAFGVSPASSWLWAPLVILLLLFFTVGVALLLSAANLFFRDVKYLVQVLLTFGIFFTPVFFEPAMFGADGARLMMVNPLAPLLEGLRLAVVQGWNLAEPLTVVSEASAVLAWSPWDLVYSAIWTAAVVICGLLVFRMSESRFAEYA